MEWKGKNVLVVGTGISGVAAAKLLAAQGAVITVMEGNENAKEADIRGKFPENMEFQLVIGELDEGQTDQLGLAVLSPGVPTDQPFVKKLREKGIPVWGEIELAYVCGKGRLVAITGTNGKTTTTALTGEIMKQYFQSVFVVGNIGMPYTEYALEMTDASMTVAEISSFQLETVHSFRPEVSAILNITPDHLNRHHTMENYIAAKAEIANNQTKDQFCILNYEDACLQKLAPSLGAEVFWFSSQRTLDQGIFLEDGAFIYQDEERIKICDIKDVKLLGVHNYENIMAACAIAMKAGVPVDAVKKAVMAFQGVEHRIEFVREVDGVKYYNDSKGTNPDAAIKAVQAMVTPTVVIGGGYDKQSEYEEWIDSFQDTVTCLVLLGETADKIEATARKAGFTNIIRVSTLKEAVEAAAAQARRGEAVLLSPACASWDMFESYEQRGRLFKEYVAGL